MDALAILNAVLQGDFISRFSVGDNWDLVFDNYTLVAQNVISKEEGRVNEWMKNNYPSFQTCVDKDTISKSAIVAAHMRKEVVSVELDHLYNLTLNFEGDSRLVIPSNEDIVDWQWCLNKTGHDPYQGYYVACFWQGEIQVNEEYRT